MEGDELPGNTKLFLFILLWTLISIIQSYLDSFDTNSKVISLQVATLSG